MMLLMLLESRGLIGEHCNLLISFELLARAIRTSDTKRGQAAGQSTIHSQPNPPPTPSRTHRFRRRFHNNNLDHFPSA